MSDLASAGLEVTARSALDPLLTVEDLEGLFKVHRRTLRRLWGNGLIPEPVKVGGSNRWVASEVADAMKELRRSKSKMGSATAGVSG